MNVNTGSALDAVRTYINGTAASDDVLDRARTAAAEFGLLYPDAATGEFLSFLAARSAGSAQPAAVVMSPACGVIGLHLFAGFRGVDGEPGGHVTCIDPEVQHQKLARGAFTSLGLRPTAFRFVPSAPLDGIGRLAADSYDIIVTDVDPELLSAAVDAALPALRPGGVLVLLDSLLDGAPGDPSRTDRQTGAARAAESHLRDLVDAGTVSTARLPLGAGMTVITRR
ncbi:O-methyltransferase [uncultured Corynebacterium sp.]|uniref:O-methyltransferase n=1 Tax=uncultured Corynebacterium sp. TaxID=159447 RepID=UPI0025D80955|nr:O-methyltransferase [uncultured Corynebacterium sp.]